MTELNNHHAIRGHESDSRSRAKDESIAQLRELIDRRLVQLIPSDDTPPVSLHSAMSYTLLSPGKRLRPLLTLLTTLHFEGDMKASLDVSCAVEMIHAASLVIDDLPIMDDSSIRRGRPTTHVAFGQDVAILASIGLLNRAFEVLSTTPALSAELRIKLISLFNASLGSDGLIAGQVMDLELRSGTKVNEELIKVNNLKTAALFAAAAEAGALIADADADCVDAIRGFAFELGAAFQIADDLIDDASYAGATGKDTGRDNNKPTVVSRNGKDQAKKTLKHHLSLAHACLDRTKSSDRRLRKLMDEGFSVFLQ